ncbi:MAG: phosphomethylpyrimidine synthase [Thermoplasmata archaeon M9B1D]|nr:MAG: phosphomethylpyrimidine synthase [Thermoplasmata archaeon M9B1D]PNX50818.1 MAG: phosphomethylpyrimidine synthase [Thermoplasmata archaeon M8B2D]
MTQLEKARHNKITKEMEFVSRKENIDVNALKNKISQGKVVIPASILHKNLSPIGIGEGLGIKVNANIGSSPDMAELEYELEKLCVCIDAKADTVMDLSTGGDIDLIRRKIIKNSNIPVGTVPVYQAACKVDDVVELSENDFLEGIRNHIEDGVDFITIHAGLLKKSIPFIKKRLMGVVSRGGALTLKWMIYHKTENPLYTHFDKILEMAKKYDVTLSLGDGLRPGCLKDATDEAQLSELHILGELTKRAWAAGVQVMIEGPGHIPLNQIEENIRLEKEICHGAPFYVLGPLVTDIAPGYDHITSAIGGCLAAYYGADFLCYVTPSEHLGLPNIEDVKKGVIASRIAAHAADVARGLKGAINWDNKMSAARSNLDWRSMLDLAIDPDFAKKVRERCTDADGEVCSMCGRFCSVKMTRSALNED